MLKSIVEYYAEHESYRCGYCRKPDTNFSHGLWAHAMTVSDYQDLIDRGWRRSGKYCYKPTMDVTCCPMYTIRCRVGEFKATKSQKKVLKKFNKFLSGEDAKTGDADRRMSTNSSTGDLHQEGDVGMGEQFLETTRSPQDINVANTIMINHEEQNLTVDGTPNEEMIETHKLNKPSSNLNELLKTTDKANVSKKGIGQDPNKSPCKKAKLLRRERKLEKLKEKGIDIKDVNMTKRNNEKELEDFINELPAEFQQRIELNLVRTSPPSPEWERTAIETHEVYVKYQTIIHEDKPEKCTDSKFKDFLVQSPLLEEHSETGPPCGYGSFHQQYWLDGKIIAVGVIDILPKCVSSVYFFYDPQYMKLTLGTYGALREIGFTRQLTELCPDLKYYYMGYYIHTCRKMRYKGNFYPSDLLCPETYNWFPLKDSIPKLEASPYARLDPDIDSVDDNFPSEADLNYIPVWVKGNVMLFKMYLRKYCNKKKESIDELMEYARLVGTKAAKSLILVR